MNSRVSGQSSYTIPVTSIRSVHSSLKVKIEVQKNIFSCKNVNSYSIVDSVDFIILCYLINVLVKTS